MVVCQPNTNIPISIPSILDTDLYKLLMQQAAILTFPDDFAEYTWIIRSKVDFPPGFGNALETCINNMRDISLSPREVSFLDSLPYMKPWYVDFLQGYRFNPREVKVSQYGSRLEIVTRGYYYRTILWEVPILALVSELYFVMTNQPADCSWVERTKSKAILLEKNAAPYSEFGTRRRYSRQIQEGVLRILKENSPTALLGTSNVYLAMYHGLNPIGTNAHEWYSAHASKFGYQVANRMALQSWDDCYDGLLNVALPDTFTTEVFLRDYDSRMISLFPNLRQDSGDPLNFVDLLVRHCEEKAMRSAIERNRIGVMPSDGLNVNKYLDIRRYILERGFRCPGAGIGTNLTNDIGGVTPLNQVMKLTSFNGIKAVKLSDTPGKHTGDPEEIRRCKESLRIA